VIAVGSFDDHNSSSWEDDTISSFSSYDGPGLREKPEVVAVGERVCTTDLSEDDVGCIDPPQGGTSLATPQVSGLAALLMQKAGLYLQPEAIKAIVMASAVHNIEGDSRVSDRDGVGGINAALAYEIVDHGRYNVAADGWYDFRTVYLSSFDVNGNLHYNVPISRGEKVRVVLTWDSHPEINDPYSNDLLYSNLDLKVYRPNNGALVASSLRNYDNFEIVEFTADETGVYDVAINRAFWNTGLEYIGVAWIKDATYLPDLRNKGGFVSQIYIRNDGAEPRNVNIHYFNYLGAPPNSGHPSDMCELNPGQHCWINVSDLQRIPSGSRASAIVDGGEDVSVTVLNVHQAYPYTTGSFAGLKDTSDNLFEPLLMRYNSNWHSDLTVFNAGSQTASVTVQYVNAAGNVCSTSFSRPPNGSINFNLKTNPGCSLPTPFVGGARVYSTNGQPLAAVANQWRDSNGDGVAESFMTYEAFPAGAASSFQPLLMRDNNTWSTGVSFQDTAGSSGNVTARYFPVDNGLQCGSNAYGLAANGIAIGNPLPPSGQCGSSPTTFVGSGWSTRGSNLASVVNQATTGSLKAMSYSAVGQGTQTVVLPLVLKNRNVPWGTGAWYSGLTVQNLGDSQATVRIVYYNADGSLLGCRQGRCR